MERRGVTLENTLIKVPAGDGNGEVIVNLAEIVKNEARLAEVATVTQITAPELLSTYNEVWLKLHRLTTRLTFERNKADNCLKRAKATAKLLCTDETLRVKGHTKSSADLREAIVELDPEVVAAKDRLDTIAVVLSMVEGKREAFYNAYNSVKKLTYYGQLPPAKYGDGNQPAPLGRKTEVDPDLDLPDGFVNPRR